MITSVKDRGLALPQLGVRVEKQMYPPPANCVLHLTGYPPLSSTITDFSGSANHGAITGATWTRLPSGLPALSFDGDDKVTITNAVSLQITNNLGVELWFKTPATFDTDATAFVGGRSIISKYTTVGNQRSWILDLVNVENGGAIDNPIIGLGDPVDGTLEYQGYSTTSLAVSTWYHALITFASGTLVLKINNVSKTLTTITGAVPATLWNSTANVLVGMFNVTANGWKGSIALPRIYNAVPTGRYQQERHLFNV